MDVVRLSTDIVDLGEHLLNHRTGELYEVNENGRRVLELLESGNVPNTQETSFMTEEGIIVFPEHNPEMDRFHLQWHLLNACNLRCKHCYDWKEKIRTLEYEQMLRVVDDYVLFLKRMEMQGEISLTGGEPFLFSRLLELIEYIKSRDVFIDVAVLSNGTILDEHILDGLKANNVGVQVSIDGVESVHDEIRGSGNYQKTMTMLAMLCQRKIPRAVHCVVMKRNHATLNQFVAEMERAPVPRVNFSRLTPIGEGASEQMLTREETRTFIQTMINLQKEVKISIIANRPLWALEGGVGICPVGYKTLTLGADGIFLPCRRLPIPLGDSRVDSFFKIWFTSPFLDKMREREKYLKVCGKCDKREQCGGCRAIANAVSGDPFASDPNCWLNPDD